MPLNRIWTKLVSLLAALATIHILEIVLAASIWLVLDWQTQNALATKLGIGPSALDFNVFITEHFKPGMTRQEIIDQADAIGSFKVKPFYMRDEYCETYFFNVGPFGTTRGDPWWICYDNADIVVSVIAAGFQ